ncbi:acylneuraminate cytidylyltransferase [Thermodesulfovibrio thiophilus]|uniref:acylneuraminate cytidylyltransferase n=1 Tax=Thermodesulfovibrio thiophilus TaxID=340095 RepID=UPI0023545A08|nr:acylneuraminate cytidylyltransferase [Thermodesulfovibrio thiophilus]
MEIVIKKVGVIPLRKGSKSIKNKNRKKLLGRPLFAWVLWEALKSKLDEVYIFTDDKNIIEYVKNEYKYNQKCRVIERSAESATDEASTELALKEYVQKINNNYDILCLLQATSPLTTTEDINKVLHKILNDNLDSALTVVEFKRFIWSKDGYPLNYDYNNRPRRQEFEGLLVENGAIYATTKEQFEKTGIRIGGNIGITKMPEDTFTELDEKRDWIIVEKLLENRLRMNKKLSDRIKAIFLDLDGVFTPGTVFFGASGELSKEFNIRDGMGLEILRESSDVEIFVITSENSEIVSSRMKKLKIENYYPGIKDKYAKVEEILTDKNIKKSETAYIGDDINDLANLLSAGWSFCPSDAMKEVKQVVDLVLEAKGGKEAIREAVDFIIKYNQRGE